MIAIACWASLLMAPTCATIRGLTQAKLLKDIRQSLAELKGKNLEQEATNEEDKCNLPSPKARPVAVHRPVPLVCDLPAAFPIRWPSASPTDYKACATVICSLPSAVIFSVPPCEFGYNQSLVTSL